MQLKEMAGMVFNPLSGAWFLSEDTSVNYIAFGVKMPHSS
jgi:polyprenyldihydroxybenzoate methyltransferase/3-demethylubiquinol 3-O-methyltransferase